MAKTNKPTRNAVEFEDKENFDFGVNDMDASPVRGEDEDWDWNPEGDLEMSPKMKAWFAENDMSYRWVLYQSQGEYYPKGVNTAKKKGYDFVRRDELPEGESDKYDRASIDAMREYVTVNDVVLMKTPNWKREIVTDKINSWGVNQLKVADDLINRQVNTGNGALETIQDSRTTVTGGGTREVDFSKRKQSK